jgi:hypothetical protein
MQASIRRTPPKSLASPREAEIGDKTAAEIAAVLSDDSYTTVGGRAAVIALTSLPRPCASA